MSVDPNLLLLHRLLYRHPARLRTLLQTGSPDQWLRSAEFRDKATSALYRQAEKDAEWLEAPQHHLVMRSDPDYPSCLAEIFDPPCLLFATGEREALAPSERLAVVGARKASSYGLRLAASLSEAVARAGVTIVSGLAMGIDAAAHEGALAAGGLTLAVLGTGCDQVYPRRNWRLAARIEQSGLILSELPLGMGAFPAHFPWRNRIVTGLSRGTLVVEAAEKSGSLISARLALSEGRDVMAVPGLVTNPQSRGSHRLLREGATLVESADDVLSELGLGASAPARVNRLPALTGLQARLVDHLTLGPESMDGLAAALELPVETLTTELVTLEILGVVQAMAGRYEICVSP